MVIFHVLNAIGWVVSTAFIVIGWWLDLPVGPGQQFMLGIALAYVALDLISRAIEAIESAIMRRHRHLDRRSQI